MSDNRESRGVLFVDIADSTRLYRLHGDESARCIVLDCLTLLDDVVGAHGGKVIDRIGDELMCTFPTARQAGLAAAAMQGAVAQHKPADGEVGDLNVRIGLHFGPVILDGARIFGDTVYTAKRMASKAKGQQIITTRETAEALLESSRLESRLVDHITLKGHAQTIEVYEIVWDKRSATVRMIAPPLASQSGGTLLLRHMGTEIVLDEECPQLTLGRGEQCDLVVDDVSVSRLHARIEHRRGYFVVVDLSTNATVIRPDDGKEVVLHQDEQRLSGTGTIVLGAGASSGGPTTLRYQVRGLQE